MQEQKLIRDLKRGKEQAFRQLIHAYENQVLNLAFTYLKDEEAAKDIGQEVFLEIFRSVGSFNQQSSLKTWIYRISVNKSIDQLRKNKKKNTQTLPEKHDFRIEGTNPEGELEKQEWIQMVDEELDRLPQTQKNAWILHKRESMSHKEIAEIMQKTLPSIETLVHRAAKSLKERLSQRLSQEIASLKKS